MKKTIDKLPEWVAEQVRKHQFADIVMRITIHDGEIKQIERQVTEKIRGDK